MEESKKCRPGNSSRSVTLGCAVYRIHHINSGYHNAKYFLYISREIHFRVTKLGLTGKSKINHPFR